ncbi:MAG: DUF3278 domain-containing protein [Lactobacillus sp.]|jgi:uncharacterized membrane-anchored protein YitT (DUF2179 family)|nr:DUF3278 domain-containing protein [Lactobacillus sp.]MCI2032900.1 DUF3278 domain-containing protein [Lactobacillus sp.]
MKTTKNHPWLRWWFGIEGVIDEHAQQVLGAMALKCLFVIMIYLMFGAPLAFLFWDYGVPAVTILTGLAIANVVVIMGILLAFEWPLRREHLRALDLDRTTFPAYRRQTIRTTIRQSLFFLVNFHLLKAVLNLLDDTPFFTTLFSPHELYTSLISGLFFGAFMGIRAYLRINNARRDATSDRFE